MRPIRRGFRLDGLVRLLGLLLVLALPFACDDDGTSPPDPDVDELPDTIPSGTYEVGDLHVPAADTFTIQGDVMLLSSGTVTLEGGLILLPGATLSVAADSLTFAGLLAVGSGPAAVAPLGGASARVDGESAGEATVNLFARRLRIEAPIEGVGIALATVEGGRIDVLAALTGNVGAASGERGVDGAPGGPVHVGDVVASDAFAGVSVNDLPAGVPALIVVSAPVRGGRGGDGFDDLVGIAEGLDVSAFGSNGGRGGNVVIRAAELDADGDFIAAGAGGFGGSCGIRQFGESTSLAALDAEAPGQAGGDVVCFTGHGGQGGSVDVSAVERILGGYVGGLGGPPGAARLRAGNGGPGGRGGNVELRAGLGGADGRPAPETVIAAVSVVVRSGGIGGDGNAPGMAGGAGGSILLVDAAGNALPLSSPIEIIGPAANGGDGYSGCVATPFIPGGAGGAAGLLVLNGGPFPVLTGDSSFIGGDGSDGRAPGAPGSGGTDDTGRLLGRAGTPGDACNSPATVTSVEPLEDILGEVDVSISILGVEFDIDTCEIFVNETKVEGECTSSSTAHAVAPRHVVQPGPNVVCAENGEPAGGRGECAEFQLYNPAPLILDDPIEVENADDGPVIELSGARFLPNAQAFLDGEPRGTEFVSSEQLRVALHAADVASNDIHDLHVTVPFGHTPSPTVQLHVVNPAPTITAISPTETETGVDFYLDVSGAGFVEGTIVRFNGADLGAPLERTRTHMRFHVGSERVAVGGNVTVHAATPEPGGGVSANVPFTIVNREPYLEIPLTPSIVFAGRESFTMTVRGAHFVPGAIVWLDDYQLATTFVSPTSVLAEVPASLMAAPARYTFTVTTPGPGGGRSNWTTFDVVHRPAISAVAPSVFERGFGTIEATIHGSNFPEGASTVRIEETPVPTTWVSESMLTAQIEQTTLPAGDVVRIDVEIDGAGPSDIYAHVVRYPRPAAALTRTAAPIGSAGIDVGVRGGPFFDGTTVRIGGSARTPSITSHTELTVALDAVDLETARNIGMIIVPPEPHLGESDPLDFTVFSHATILGLDPESVSRGCDGVGMRVFTDGYIDGAVVTFNDIPGVTNAEDGALVTTIPASVCAAPGEVQVGLVNQGLPSSNTMPLTVLNPEPMVETVVPTGAILGATGFAIHVEGVALFDDTELTFNGSPIDATPSAKGISFTAELADVAAGTILGELTNGGPGGGTTSFTFALVDPTPVLARVEPSVVAPGFSGTLALTGANFRPGAQVFYRIGDGPAVHATGAVRVSESLIELAVGPELTGSAADAVIHVSNADDFPADWPGPDGPYESTPVTFAIADADPCDVGNPDLPVIEYGEPTTYSVSNSDCPGPVIAGKQTYYRLFRITIGQTATQLALQPDMPTEYSFLTPDGALIGFFVSSFRKVFYPGGMTMVVKAATGSTFPTEASGDITIGPAAVEELIGCTGADIWAGASTTQTLSDAGSDISCVNSNLDGDERRLDRFAVRVPPDRTIRITMTSSQIDPVLFFRIPPSDEYVEDATPGDGIAVVEYTNTSSSSEKGEFTATTPFYDSSDPARLGSYTVTVELLE